MKKIVIVGAGKVGSVIANLLYHDVDAEIVLIDVIEGRADAIAQSYNHVLRNRSTYGTGSLTQDIESSSNYFYGHIRGSTHLDDLKDADIVIHTAGRARTPDMDRMDLLRTNAEIAHKVATRVAECATQAHIIVVANPLDIISYVFHKTTGFTHKKIVGMAGVLDSARFAYYLNRHIGLCSDQVATQMLGGHGDAMLSVPEHNSMGGFLPSVFFSQGELAEKIEHVRQGGAEIVNLYKEGSAYMAPAASVFSMVKSLVTGCSRIISASVYVEGGVYGKGMCVGLPILYGGDGIIKIFDLTLDELYQSHMNHSIRTIQEGIRDVAYIIGEESS